MYAPELVGALLLQLLYPFHHGLLLPLLASCVDEPTATGSERGYEARFDFTIS